MSFLELPPPPSAVHDGIEYQNYYQNTGKNSDINPIMQLGRNQSSLWFTCGLDAEWRTNIHGSPAYYYTIWLVS